MSIFDGLPAIFTGTFGEAVTITPQSGDPFEIEGIVARRPEIDLDGYATHRVYLAVPTERAVEIADGDQVLARGKTYKARTREDDEGGMTQFWLELA